MRRIAILAVTAFVVAGLAQPVHAQKKQKDQVLEQFLIAEFAKLNAKLDSMADRLAAAEAEISRLKQAQAESTNEIRSTQTVVKTTDTSLSTFRLSTQQDLFSLKTDLTQLRQDLARLGEAVKGATQPPPAPAPTTTEAASVEGYVTTNPENNEVNVSLGSASGVRIGTEFRVFKANDPKTEVGILEVIQVLDGNNSRAKIVYLRPAVKLEFSDIVRPRA